MPVGQVFDSALGPATGTNCRGAAGDHGRYIRDRPLKVGPTEGRPKRLRHPTDA